MEMSGDLLLVSDDIHRIFDMCKNWNKLILYNVECFAIFVFWGFVQVEDGANLLLNVLCMDEARFSLSGSINTQNNLTWVTEKPYALV